MVFRNTKIISSDGNLSEAAKALSEGLLVSFPTETVYGLGANALDTEAVKTIFEAKGRPSDNPLIVHIYDRSQLDKLTIEIPEFALPLMERFWPGPLTLVFKKSAIVPFEVTAGLDTVAIRIPDHPVALKLLKTAGVPIAAPSANVSGKPSPTCAKDVMEDLMGRVDFIVEGGTSDIGVESTVLDITQFPPVILRPGAVTAEQILKITGEVVFQKDQVSIPRSPGTKYKHYSPNAEMTLISGDVLSIVKNMLRQIGKYPQHAKFDSLGIMATDQTLPFYFMEGPLVITAGDRHSPSTIAAKLFSILRKFDRRKVDKILAEGVDISHIGKAIMNRLTKAACGNVINSNSEKFKLLFVCTGNTCRSAMSEGIMKSLSQDVNLEISSVGVAANEGISASENAIEALKMLYDIDISSHKSRLITNEIIEDADLILTMEPRHSVFVRQFLSHTEYKTCVLTRFVGYDDFGIADPYGGSLGEYMECARQIHEVITKLHKIFLF